MKKILTVLLAAAVIFGFAACSPSTVSYFGKDVLSITVASAPDLFAGETLNPADVQLRVVYDDHTEEMFTGAQLGMERNEWTTGGSAPFAMAEGANTFVVKYGVKTDANDVVVSKESKITINTVSFHELVIDGSAVTSIDASDVSSMSDVLDKIAFTAYYNNGADSKPVSATLAQTLVPDLFGGSIVTLVPVKGTEDQYEVTAAAGNNVTIDPEWIVTVTGTEQPTITGVRLENTNDIFNLAAVPEGERDTLGDVKYDVYAVYSDNTEVKLVPGTDYDATKGVEFTEYARYTFDGSSNLNTFAVAVTLLSTSEYADDLAEGTDVLTGTLTIDFAEDYPTKITATEKTNNLVMQGEKISVDDFDFVVTEWKSGAVYTPNKEITSGITLDEAEMKFVRVPFGYSDGKEKTAKVNVAFKYADRTVIWNDGTSITVTVENTPATT